MNRLNKKEIQLITPHSISVAAEKMLTSKKKRLLAVLNSTWRIGLWKPNKNSAKRRRRFVMNSEFLNQMLSQFCEEVSVPTQYVFPTLQNLAAGSYISEILNVKEVLRDDGSLEAVDFYHKLAESNGNVIHARFRYYAKELPSLVSSLKQYPQVQTWQNVIGLQEEITVVQKTTGNYMRISSRHAPAIAVTSASTASTTSLGVSATKSPAKNKVGGSIFGSKHRNTPQPTVKPPLLLEDDEFDDWEDDSDDE